MNSDLNILGFDVYCNKVGVLVETSLNTTKPLVLNTINPHSYVEQKSDPEFHKALSESDFLIPDGSGIVMAAKSICNKKIEKIAGFDLFEETMSQLNNRSGKVFFLGSAETVLSKIKLRAQKDFPNVEIGTLSPPFKPTFDEPDIESFAKSINDFVPDVVFVGLTAPKQEKLIFLLKERCTPKYFSGIGAVFDFYAGAVKRPSEFWVKLHLEWLIRFLGEPKRLWKRNFVSTPIFLKDVWLAAIKTRLSKRERS